jgi:hypothetical protein
MLIHIRNSKQSGRDRRTKVHRGNNKLSPTLCGSEPCRADWSKPEAQAFVASWLPLLAQFLEHSPERIGVPGGLPIWVAENARDLCPDCRAKVG